MTTADELTESGRMRRHVPLAGYTTYRLGGPARFLVEADSEEDVLACAAFARDEGLPVLPLGRGSNVVVASAGFDGVVLHAGPGLSGVDLGDPALPVVAGAGCPLPVLARATAAEGRGGLEFYTGIPGSVGGAVRMNAGCHGSDTAAWLVSARIVDLERAVAGERSAASLGFGYRTSNLGDGDFVVSASFRTEPSAPEASLGAIREITRWRRLHQPGGTLNAGSVFKNPPGDAAGRIIDELGLKGLAVGGASVSERHANFFVAGPGATPEDVHGLVVEVRRRVRAAAGIDLEPEIRFVGDFA
jgi:UDP-N-acetylmuramate dehydrogenase